MNRPSEERFFTLALDMLCVASFDGFFTRVNPAFEETLGYTTDELLSKPFVEFVHPDDREATLAELSHLADGGKTIRFENRYLRKDGSYAWLAWKAVPVVEEGLAYATARDITQRKEAEEALAKSEERTRLAVEATDLGTWDFDPIGGSLAWDGRTREMFDIPSDAEVRYEDFLAGLHPDDVEKTDNAVRAALDPGGDGTFDVEYRTVGGAWVHATGQAFFEGTPRRAVRFIGTVLDITRRKADEDRARFVSELGQILQPMADPDEIVATTARMLGEHLSADRCAYAEVEEDENTFTITGDYANGVPHIVGRFTMRQFGEEALRLMRRNEPYVVEDSEADARIGERDLEAYHLTQIRAVVCVPLHKNGRFAAGMAVHQMEPRRWTEEEIETTTTVVERCWESIERARAMRSLRESEERYRTLAAASASIVWIFDPDEGFVEPQPSWEEYTGQSWEEHRGFGWKEAIHPEDRERMLAAWEEARATKTLYSSDGRLWHAKDGTHRHYIARALPIFAEGGEVREWVGMIGDVEDLRRAESEIRRLNEGLEERVRERTAELAEAVEELESFSYSVSHDLRAPIRHIDGFSRMLDERCGDVLDETGRRYLGTIIRATRRAGNLVDDLLAFSRMGRSGMEESSVDMDGLVREAIEELEPDTNGRNVAWSVGDLPEVRGDRAMIRVAVRNLLANAIKYTRPREEAEISVGCESDGDEFAFRVRDNGVGFDMAYVDKLFGVFQRLHGPEEFEGTGIGLASVKRVARRHGGRVWAEGAPEEGAVFYFTLPRKGGGRDGQGE